MALLNQNSILFYDGNGNIHQFIETRGQVDYLSWNRATGKGSREQFCENVREIKGWMEPKDTMYLFCVNQAGQLIFYEIFQNTARKKLLEIGAEDRDVRDIAMFVQGERIYLLYTCLRAGVENGAALFRRRLVRLSFAKRGKGDEMGPVRKDLLEFTTGMLPSEVIAREFQGRVYMTAVEKVPGRSSVNILRQETDGKAKGLVKVTMEDELFWYDLFVTEGALYLAYTIRVEGMFSIRYVVYDLESGSLTEAVSVRERQACTHPIFVLYKGELWLCWYENGSVSSCIVEADRILEGPMKWRDSVGRDILLNEFYVNNRDFKKRGQFQCRKVFCSFPENHITGFGKDNFGKDDH